MSGFNPKAYGRIFAVKQAYSFDIGCLLMRFYIAMLNMGTLTMLTLSGYSFISAGITSSIIAFSIFFISPQLAKLVDAKGQHKIVPIASAVSLTGLVIVIFGVVFHAPIWLFFAAAVPLGAIPNPQALTRSRWTYLIRMKRLGENAPDIQTVFAYEGVLDDSSFMFGPAISIALASSVTPIAGMLAGGIVFAIGSIMLSLSRSTEPEPGWTDDPETLKKEENDPDSKRSKSVIRSSFVVRVLFVTMFCMGAVFGIMDSSTVALAEELGDPNIAGLVLMLASLVSVVCGIVFGMFNIKAKPLTRMIATSTLVGIAYGTIFLIDSTVSLFVISTYAAAFYAPFVITNNYICERAVDSVHLTEGITWMNSACTCGMAFGPSLAGFVIDFLGASVAFDIGAIMAIAIPISVLVAYRPLKREIRDDA